MQFFLLRSESRYVIRNSTRDCANLIIFNFEKKKVISGINLDLQ